MAFVRMELLSFHKTAYAHTLTARDYRYGLDSHGFGIYGGASPQGGVLEIGVVEKNPLILRDMDTQRTYTVCEMDAFVIPPNHRIDVRTMEPGEHRHTSAEFLVDSRVERCADDARMREMLPPRGDARLILPYVLPGARENEELIGLVRQIARDRMLLTEKSYFAECAECMRLLALIDASVRRAADTHTASPGHRRYCQMAKEYLSANICRRVSLGELANHVGISKNYLTDIFSRSEGMPISEYANRLKLDMMAEMIVKYDYSVPQSGEYVGFDDENYVRRLFKRYYGVTISEYKKMRRKP